MIITYYDLIKLIRKDMLSFLELDIKKRMDLGKRGEVSGVFNVDKEKLPNLYEYLDSVEDQLRENFLNNAFENGLNIEEAKNLMKDPQIFKPVEDLLNTLFFEYMSFLNFELFGKKVFRFNNNLVENLFFTDLSIPSDFLRLPFKSCLFVYESKIAISSLYKITGKENEKLINAPISVFLTELPSENGKRKLLLSCWQADVRASYAFVKRELLIRDDWDISKMLKTDWKEIYDDESLNDDDKNFYEEGLDFFRIVLNSVLYLASNEADLISKLSPRKELEKKIERLSSKSKMRKIKREIEKTSELDYEFVGSKSKNIVIKKPHFKIESLSKSERKIASRFMVRGHWRKQPFGRGLNKSKLIFIEPYLKGPEMAELINKNYEVK